MSRLCVAGLIALSSPAFGAERPSLSQAKRWACFYGSTMPREKYEALDLAILEPDAFEAPRASRHPLRLGYVSVGQVEKSRWYAGLSEGKSFVLEPDPDWPDARRVDVRSTQWQDLLLDQVMPKIIAKGYDGFFLDTIDTAGYLEEKDPGKYAGSLGAMAAFIHRVRGRFPRALIVTNNGLPLLPRISRDIDGALAEDLYTRYDFRTKSYVKTPPEESREMEGRLRSFARKTGRPVFVIIYGAGGEAPATRAGVRRAVASGFRPYVATVALDELGEAAPLPRKILALYDRAALAGEFKDIFFSDVHQRAEMPLNHLGMEVVYRELGRPLPSVSELRGFAGALIWFERPAGFAPAPFCRWALGTLDAGVKIVILGKIPFAGGAKGEELPADCRRVLARLGVEYEGEREPSPIALDIPPGAHPMAEFERKLAAEELDHVPILRVLPGATSYLTVTVREPPEVRSDPIAVSPDGGIALDPFVMYQNLELEPAQLRWRLDPFSFFEAAFGLAGRPRPDVTTVNGRRLYFSQIDGDSFFNPSESDPRKWSAQVFLENILQARPDTPFTASVITGYYDLPRFSRPQAFSVSRRILNLPNVEPASHGYGHPLSWHKKTVAVQVPGYRYDPAKEIVSSADMIDRRLLSGNRKTGLFLWTGDALPLESDIGLSFKRGLRNLNGGWTRFDRLYASYAFVAPLGRRLGAFRQIYAPDSNEEVYTDLWRGPFYGFREVLETFQRTESPRRVAPVDVYVHYYSAEKTASLITLKKIYDWAREEPLFPAHAGEYADMAQGFFDMRITPSAPGVWRFEEGSRVRTARFDAEPREPDLSRSKGVIGWKRFQGSLYVFFDESPERELALVPDPPRLPHLVEANFRISSWRSDGAALSFAKRGWWKGELVLGGLKPRARYAVSSAGESRELESDDAGELRASFPDSERGGAPRAVTVEAVP